MSCIDSSGAEVDDVVAAVVVVDGEEEWKGCQHQCIEFEGHCTCEVEDADDAVHAMVGGVV